MVRRLLQGAIRRLTPASVRGLAQVSLGRLAQMLVLFAMSMAGALAAVDANTATQAELREVPGIGPAIAARIVKERRRTPYQDIADLQQRVRGIGDANVRRMVQGGLVVGGGAAQERPPRASPVRKAGADAASSTAVGRGVVIERPAAAPADPGAASVAPAAPGQNK